MQESNGAQFHSLLHSHLFEKVISKGTEEASEAYSGFEGTELCAFLKTYGINKIFVCGLATDYCVRATAIDARKEGFEVMLLGDCVQSVDIQKGDGEKALQEMIKFGCDILTSNELK